mmetsp:Transcript_26317/g.58918  ORF Transcript_26317/g.58918 Transcript_26317/m.58918 type:complete len:124 (+) Transcript_26317:311-682(+)|eukprot:CAMPEP_0172608756 /NCGR_PEP_ID=MMETSP1068-20121228/28824_1 /TAXON_ID=35684 /ORGANISM="Pseudopedinella elastica, Strain CCMP716" /LENGTH=123 /DNA_ID=CAMNT_0013412101 /DNA_START=237 /DNA_END=608 /DNA_ORIENTATION=-
MRLLTHNSLRCSRKDVASGYPLKIHADKVDVRQSPCNRDFIVSMIPNLNWQALRVAAREVGIDSLPEELTDDLVSDDNFIYALHHILFDVHVTEGRLECPESGQIFNVKGGVAFMDLDEDIVM